MYNTKEPGHIKYNKHNTSTLTNSIEAGGWEHRRGLEPKGKYIIVICTIRQKKDWKSEVKSIREEICFSQMKKVKNIQGNKKTLNLGK